MASMTLPPVFVPVRIGSVSSSDDTPTKSQDPFWQSTPRIVTSHGPEAGRKVTKPTQQPTTTKQPRGAKSAANRRPQCTHMTMSRVHGNSTCQMCGRKPGIGWLYVCTQVCDFDELDPPNPDGFLVVPDESSYYEVQARLAESLGLSPYVVKSIRDQDYSFEQVDKLIEQKRHLLAVIKKQEAALGEKAQAQNVKPQAATESLIASVGYAAVSVIQHASHASAATEERLTSNNGAGPAKKTRNQYQGCNFQICHPCRPFFKDRLYMSFEKMLSGRLPAVTEEEIKTLPMHNPAIVANIDYLKLATPLMPTPLSTSFDRNVHQGDGSEEDESSWTPTTATISESDFEGQDERDLYPCPGAAVCPLWSRYSGCAYDGDFDDGLRALNHGFGPEPDLTRMTPENSLSRLRRMRGSISDTPGGSTSTQSSISLPSTPGFAPLTPITPTDQSFEDALTMRLNKPGKAATICGPMLAYKRRSGRYGLGLLGRDSGSSLGSEVEVPHGVALTETAVTTCVPDILTDDEEE
ncbi:hypothetical protein LTR10_001117 [Elasticomyces elasticus]|nr:hypothetical protein LTR10_001117 [Elasticomyces elasticus]